MQFRKVTEAELDAALEAVNRIYQDNIYFKEKSLKKPATPRFNYENWNIRLGVRDTTRERMIDGKMRKATAPGVSLRPQMSRDLDFIGYKRLAYPCWHTWGEFFRALPERTEIITRFGVKHPSDAWDDWNMRSFGIEYSASSACNCEPNYGLSFAGDCIPVRAMGLKACENCQYRDTRECGGGMTRQALLGKLGDKALYKEKP